MSIPVEQIDRIDIITNPGARYEAEGNAGIIDIRVTAPDVASLDAIEKSVSASDRYRASIQSTDQVGDRINSRIQVREN